MCNPFFWICLIWLFFGRGLLHLFPPIRCAGRTNDNYFIRSNLFGLLFIWINQFLITSQNLILWKKNESITSHSRVKHTIRGINRERKTIVSQNNLWHNFFRLLFSFTSQTFTLDEIFQQSKLFDGYAIPRAAFILLCRLTLCFRFSCYYLVVDVQISPATFTVYFYQFLICSVWNRLYGLHFA